jgi:hypothetical protein
MPTPLDDVLHHAEQNYILPFLWLHGETEAVLREEIAHIHAAGIRALCVEARPHPDFFGPRWWHDLDIIMAEARQRHMRVWLLDDDSFPTGHAAGQLIGAPAALRRLFIQEHHLDALGPQPGSLLPLQPWTIAWPQPHPSVGATLVAVVAARRDPTSDQLTGELIDLTEAVQGNGLYWDVPDGYWRIFVISASPEGGMEHEQDYINPLVPASVRVLIDAVYEPFAAHYAADFGSTFAGFFSDEPGFYNDREMPYDYNARLGKRELALPWSETLLSELTAAFGSDYRRLLPLLWFACGAATSAVRFTYMDVITRLYAQHFTDQIGGWCRAHGVEYIGHVLEDNGNHARLGAGAGHFFRALGGQDMAGIDVVLSQLAPGFDQGPYAHIAADADGEFYHYGLAKLGSSLAHLDPKKKGRTVAEVFGAYGWRAGLKLMKWLTDHMLVRGVNYFVPHAFSPAPFPDPDCPPHFYAHGENPQYRYYRWLNDYTNRLSHLLSGGQHLAALAVLYHAEAEWSGPAMPFQRPVGALLRRQIDCDVVPVDSLLGASTVSGARLAVGTETYAGLVVPWCEALPAPALHRLLELAQQGLPLFFVDAWPTRSSDGSAVNETLRQLALQANVRVVPLADLADTITRLGFHEVTCDAPQPYLRCYHYRHPGLEVYLFFNEHPTQPINTRVRLPTGGPFGRYDALTNTLLPFASAYAGGESRLNLQLSPYETALLVSGAAVNPLLAALEPAAADSPAATQELVLSGPWQISTATAKQYPAFEAWGSTDALFDLTRPGTLPGFSGTFRYQASFEAPTPSRSAQLDLGAVYEVVELWVNEQPAGTRLAPPYRFDIGPLLQPGANTLTIDVTNTLVNAQPDFYSRYATQEPSGLLGPVRLRWSGAR